MADEYPNRASMPGPGPGAPTEYFGDNPIGPDEGQQIAQQEMQRLMQLYRTMPQGPERDAVGQRLDALMKQLAATATPPLEYGNEPPAGVPNWDKMFRQQR